LAEPSANSDAEDTDLSPTVNAPALARPAIGADEPEVAPLAAIVPPQRGEFPRWPVYVIAFGVIVALMKVGQSFLVPVLVAVLIFYALVWPVDALERLRVPRAIGAALVMFVLIGATTVTVYAVWTQVNRIAEAVPSGVKELQNRWGRLKYDRESTISKLQGSADAVQRAMSSDAPAPRNRSAQTPAPTPSTGSLERYLLSGTITAAELLSTIAAVYLLAYFLLIDGDHFRRRWVSFAGQALSTRRVTVQALNAIDKSIRRYLGMLVATNATLGVLTYVALRVVGVDNAAGWGVLAGLLHVIPYFGPILVAGGVFVTSLHEMGDMDSAVYAALATVAVAVVIGTFAQTWMTARIARMNTSVVFVSILLFSWLWGGAGLLLAVPIAVIVKVVLGAVPVLNPIGELLGDGRREK